MDHAGLAQQVLLEHQTLESVTAALRVTMGWSYEGDDLSRKLSSLTFVGKSFQRHLKRLIALEEEGGYMAVVLESRPELSEEVASLEQEHGRFRKALAGILRRLRQVSPDDRARLASLSDELGTMLDAIDAHNRKENRLLQEALLRDEGGEG